MSLSPAVGVLRRNFGLDLLRGAAILLVLGNHLAPQTIPALAPLHGLPALLYWRIRSIGWTGVDLFFVLSGFLISGLLFQEIERTGTIRLRKFWTRRGLKILPSYVFLLGVLGLTGATFWLDTTSVASTAASIIRHGLFLQNYQQENPNGPTWSLAVEIHFYLLLPCLLYALALGATPSSFARRVWIAGAVGVLGIFLLRVIHFLTSGIAPDDYRLSHFRMDSLLVGCLTQFLVRRRHPLVEIVRKYPGLALALAGLLISPALILGTMHPLMFTLGYSLLAAGYALVVLVFAHGIAFTHPQPSLRFLTVIGGASYNIFLWNYFVARLPLPGYSSLQSWLASHISSPGLAVMAQGTLFVAVSVGLGMAATRFVEAPFLRPRLGPCPPRPFISEPRGLGSPA